MRTKKLSAWSLTFLNSEEEGWQWQGWELTLALLDPTPIQTRNGPIEKCAVCWKRTGGGWKEGQGWRFKAVSVEEQCDLWGGHSAWTFFLLTHWDIWFSKRVHFLPQVILAHVWRPIWLLQLREGARIKPGTAANTRQHRRQTLQQWISCQTSGYSVAPWDWLQGASCLWISGLTEKCFLVIIIKIAGIVKDSLSTKMWK